MSEPPEINEFLDTTRKLGLDHIAGPQLLNDLRLRVLDGDDLEPHEMLAIVNQIRENRRSAAAKATAIKGAKKEPKSNRRLTADEREALLNEELS